MFAGTIRRGLQTFAVASAVMVGACSISPSYERPSLDIPVSWRDDQTQSSVWPATDWWRGFGSPQLDNFVAEAQESNFDMAAAAARVREANAQVRVAGAALLPSVDFSGGVSRVRESSTSTPGVSRGRGVGASPLYNAQINASYEIDFWRKNQAALEAAQETAQAFRYDEETIALTTVSAVATTYFQILEFRDRLAVAEHNLESAEGVLEALRAQVQFGTATALDVAQQETTVATVRASIPPLQQQLRQFIDALAILVGKPPEAVDVATGSLQDLSYPVVAPGLPSELLARRPDVATAEAQLISAHANIAVARAAFFPSVVLTAEGGIESVALSTLFGPEGLLYTLAAGVTQPIFEGGRLEGQLENSKAFYDEMLQDYRKAVISAFQDVEDALVAVEQTAEQQRRQQAAVASAQQAFDIATSQLRAGTVNVLTVLNTETALFTAEDALAQVQAAHLNAIVALFQALGGGWTQDGNTGETHA